MPQHAINSGIIKLSSFTPVINVYRGMSGLRLPPQLENANKMGSRLAIEYGKFAEASGSLMLLFVGQACLTFMVLRSCLVAGFMSTVRLELLSVCYSMLSNATLF